MFLQFFQWLCVLDFGYKKKKKNNICMHMKINYVPLQYYQIVIKNTPAGSYNESIRNQAQTNVEQEIHGEYSSIPVEDQH